MDIDNKYRIPLVGLGCSCCVVSYALKEEGIDYER